MEEDKDQENKNLNEPPFPYKTIRGSTFGDLEEENRNYSLSLSPVQRLRYLKELNVNAFGRKSLLMKEIDRRIYKK
ncbi:hypothetical protein BH23BAC1_BH23BAC1_40790 [soil metagenome]